ncbi:Vi polysaccharide biosynthesis protein TviE [Oligella urethralis]|uniref:glycosyltransferase family 4 protein n=1 Tax=Oligella urethralis TaxID=90245 RepID=UPI000E03C1B0|nr:glycosyltransferase family 4 protein [Oligella urethralis]SUA56877.1 Vi polysaccharide biosynthesis protein TviE [Oligella urethralis]
MKKILFLSALDFKEKSIQVIKKTPEAYADNGWDVNYIVARDTAKNGNYYYESVINIETVSVKRFFWPFAKLRSVRNRYIALFFSKISSFIVVIKLFFYGSLYLLRNKDCGYVYGYEMHGVLASNLIKIIFFFRKIKYIARFQGVFYIKEHLEKKRLINLIFNFDLLLGLWLPTDLMIMTNDGTKGDVVLAKIKSRARKNLLFITNGVNVRLPEINESLTVAQKYQVETDSFNILMVSRLVSIKRVHLAIEGYHRYIKKGGIPFFTLIIVGEGPELDALRELVFNYGLDNKIQFLGAVANSDVFHIMAFSKALLSLYESSNIGNPFFESMISGLPFIAVNNGDTSSFVIDGYNGILINENTIVEDLVSIFGDIYNGKINLNELAENVKNYASNNISCWEKRMLVEINKVKSL